jgi:ATP-dependent Zn protease
MVFNKRKYIIKHMPRRTPQEIEEEIRIIDEMLRITDEKINKLRQELQEVEKHILQYHHSE